jgi:hypothetical protein
MLSVETRQRKDAMKVTAEMSISLDGYFAGPNDGPGRLMRSWRKEAR